MDDTNQTLWQTIPPELRRRCLSPACTENVLHAKHASITAGYAALAPCEHCGRVYFCADHWRDWRANGARAEHDRVSCLKSLDPVKDPVVLPESFANRLAAVLAAAPRSLTQNVYNEHVTRAYEAHHVCHEAYVLASTCLVLPGESQDAADERRTIALVQHLVHEQRFRQLYASATPRAPLPTEPNPQLARFNLAYALIVPPFMGFMEERADEIVAMIVQQHSHRYRLRQPTRTQTAGAQEKYAAAMAILKQKYGVQHMRVVHTALVQRQLDTARLGATIGARARAQILAAPPGEDEERDPMRAVLRSVDALLVNIVFALKDMLPPISLRELLDLFIETLPAADLAVFAPPELVHTTRKAYHLANNGPPGNNIVPAAARPQRRGFAAWHATIAGVVASAGVLSVAGILLGALSAGIPAFVAAGADTGNNAFTTVRQVGFGASIKERQFAAACRATVGATPLVPGLKTLEQGLYYLLFSTLRANAAIQHGNIGQLLPAVTETMFGIDHTTWAAPSWQWGIVMSTAAFEYGASTVLYTVTSTVMRALMFENSPEAEAADPEWQAYLTDHAPNARVGGYIQMAYHRGLFLLGARRFGTGGGAGATLADLVLLMGEKYGDDSQTRTFHEARRTMRMWIYGTAVGMLFAGLPGVIYGGTGVRVMGRILVKGVVHGLFGFLHRPSGAQVAANPALPSIVTRVLNDPRVLTIQAELAGGALFAALDQLVLGPVLGFSAAWSPVIMMGSMLGQYGLVFLGKAALTSASKGEWIATTGFLMAGGAWIYGLSTAAAVAPTLGTIPGFIVGVAVPTILFAGTGALMQRQFDAWWAGKSSAPPVERTAAQIAVDVDIAAGKFAAQVLPWSNVLRALAVQLMQRKDALLAEGTGIETAARLVMDGIAARSRAATTKEIRDQQTHELALERAKVETQRKELASKVAELDAKLAALAKDDADVAESVRVAAKSPTGWPLQLRTYAERVRAQISTATMEWLVPSKDAVDLYMTAVSLFAPPEDAAFWQKAIRLVFREDDMLRMSRLPQPDPVWTALTNAQQVLWELVPSLLQCRFDPDDQGVRATILTLKMAFRERALADLRDAIKGVGVPVDDDSDRDAWVADTMALRANWLAAVAEFYTLPAPSWAQRTSAKLQTAAVNVRWFLGQEEVVDVGYGAFTWFDYMAGSNSAPYRIQPTSALLTATGDTATAHALPQAPRNKRAPVKNKPKANVEAPSEWDTVLTTTEEQRRLLREAKTLLITLRGAAIVPLWDRLEAAVDTFVTLFISSQEGTIAMDAPERAAADVELTLAAGAFRQSFTEDMSTGNLAGLWDLVPPPPRMVEKRRRNAQGASTPARRIVRVLLASTAIASGAVMTFQYLWQQEEVRLVNHLANTTEFDVPTWLGNVSRATDTERALWVEQGTFFGAQLQNVSAVANNITSMIGNIYAEYNAGGGFDAGQALDKLRPYLPDLQKVETLWTPLGKALHGILVNANANDAATALRDTLRALREDGNPLAAIVDPARQPGFVQRFFEQPPEVRRIMQQWFLQGRAEVGADAFMTALRGLVSSPVALLSSVPMLRDAARSLTGSAAWMALGAVLGPFAGRAQKIIIEAVAFRGHTLVLLAGQQFEQAGVFKLVLGAVLSAAVMAYLVGTGTAGEWVQFMVARFAGVTIMTLYDTLRRLNGDIVAGYTAADGPLAGLKYTLTRGFLGALAVDASLSLFSAATFGQVGPYADVKWAIQAPLVAALIGTVTEMAGQTLAWSVDNVILRIPKYQMRSRTRTAMIASCMALACHAPGYFAANGEMDMVSVVAHCGLAFAGPFFYDGSYNDTFQILLSLWFTGPFAGRGTSAVRPAPPSPFAPEGQSPVPGVSPLPADPMAPPPTSPGLFGPRPRPGESRLRPAPPSPFAPEGQSPVSPLLIAPQRQLYMAGPSPLAEDGPQPDPRALEYIQATYVYMTTTVMKQTYGPAAAYYAAHVRDDPAARARVRQTLDDFFASAPTVLRSGDAVFDLFDHVLTL